MKSILVIGIGWEQSALIKQAKKQNLKIIATHPFLTEEAIELADVFHIRDSRDIQAHLKIAQTYNVDAIVTDNCDYSLHTASFVAKAMGLDFAPILSAKYSNDKYAQRVVCKKAEIRQPLFHLVETYEEIIAAAHQLKYTLIVKPVDSRGTYGVTIVREKNALSKAYFEAIIHSPSRRVICEEFINGVLTTVDGFCFSNGHQSLTIASRTYTLGSKPITKEIIYPATFDFRLKEKILATHHKVVEALKYQFGHTHGEYIITENNEVFLVECANRGGGVYTSSTIVPYLTGIDVNSILINQSLRKDHFVLKRDKKNYMKKSIMLTFLDFEVGKVVKSINLEYLKSLDYVLKFRSIFKEKDMVESVENCASRHSMLVIQGNNVKDVYKNLKEFKSKMRIEYYAV